jgi:hypothetical protein
MDHFYSWTDGFSTDPAWRPNKGYNVFCNGQLCMAVMYCVTGERGFVKAYQTDAVGRITGRGATLYVGKVTVVSIHPEPAEEKSTTPEVTDGITPVTT